MPDGRVTSRELWDLLHTLADRSDPGALNTEFAVEILKAATHLSAVEGQFEHLTTERLAAQQHASDAASLRPRNDGPYQ